MHPRTAATLDELKRTRWFRCVGVQDTEAAVVLSSWYEAIESCNSCEWEDLCLEAANQLRERIAERSMERFQLWNQLATELRPIAVALATEKTKAVLEENELPETFLDTVKWDILHLLMEAEYADIYPPGFYASQGYWYVHGHFPCGWQGDFPKGTLIIY
ncbi:MAG TPA: hypothetical protein PLD58_22710 [Phycisphaerae bacterium]|nr:hypothetical protein [Phycisphaerae bacterium]